MTVEDTARTSAEGFAPFRTATGGRVDRSRTVRFTFAGEQFDAHPGDTVASALLAAGHHQIGTSVKLGRPRGVGAAWAECPTSLVQVEEPFPEPMLLASTIEVFDGLVADGIPGQGRLAEIGDSARYDSRHVHVDVAVVGAGPAGLQVALTAARSGARVALIDEQAEAGGSLLSEPASTTIDGVPSQQWVAAAVAELAANPDVVHLQRSTVFGVYDDGFLLAVERRTDHLGTAAAPHRSRQRVHRVRAGHVVVATGAHERPVVFTDNDRPGTMLAGAARTFLHRYGVLAGSRAVVFTTNDSAYAAALDLADAGVDVALVVEARPVAPQHWRAECERRGIEIRTGAAVVGTTGTERVTGALVADLTGAETLGRSVEVGCDLLLVSGGWNPAVHLHSQARGKLVYDAERGAFLPVPDLTGLTSAGSAAGTQDLPATFASAGSAAVRALTAVGLDLAAAPASPSTPAAPPVDRGLTLWKVPDPAGTGARQFVDVQRDATVADIARAVGAGMRSVEHVKRYTTIGTAHDQGKTSGIVASGILAGMLGTGEGVVGTTTFRPPYTPVAFATLAGRDRGQLFDPVRTTTLHARHVAAGAVFEDVGQWKRPRFYPLAGENMETAVLRECDAARTGVAILDGSTLGKIDVSGPDAPEFLDRLYTNMMSTLAVGKIRYGVMCRADGMILDDGVALRLAADRYLVMTTTGGAATVLDWMEEWLQTEWPDLRVHLASVTEQYAAIPVVGPRSRDVLDAVFGGRDGVDVSKDAFQFMTFVDTELGGVPVRLARISFSGELAWEVHVDARWAGAVWDRLVEAGKPYAITRYGTETMHVLRAEKGFPIIGQDSDGTVTPQDLGMSWVVSKKKVDFVGKRSHARPFNSDPLRKQLVGLLPLDGTTVLPEGSQIIESPADGIVPPPPVPMLGHVTSSYRSAFLQRPFALALVGGGFERVGGQVSVVVAGNPVPCEITSACLVDAEGARRDG